MTEIMNRLDYTDSNLFAAEGNVALKTLSELACANNMASKAFVQKHRNNGCNSDGNRSLRSLNSEFHHMLTWRIWADGDGDWSDLCELYLQRSRKSVENDRAISETATKRPCIAAGEPVKRKLLIPDLCDSDSDSDETEPEVFELLPLNKRVCRRGNPTPPAL